MLSLCKRHQLMITSPAQSDRWAKLEHGKALFVKARAETRITTKPHVKSPRLSACGVSVVAYARDSADEKHILADTLSSIEHLPLHR